VAADPETARAVGAVPRGGRAPEAIALATGAALGASLFAAAYDNGAYSLQSRSTIAIAVWWTILVGIAFGIWPRHRAPRGAIAVGVLLAGFACWDLASSAWAPSAETAVSEFDRSALYLGVYVLAVLTSAPSRLLRWLDGLVLGVLAIAVVALVSRLFPGSFPARGLPALLPTSSTRLSFPLGYWNGLAIFVALAFPLLLFWMLEGGRFRRPAAAAAFPAIGAVLYLSSSRGAAAALACGALVFVAAQPRRLAACFGLVAAGAGFALSLAVLRSQQALVEGPLGSAAARSDGHRAAVLLLGACAVLAVAVEAAVALAPRLPRPSRPLRIAGAVVVLVACLAAAGAEGWSLRHFSRLPPTAPASVQGNAVSDHLLSGSGSGRWQFWTASLHEFESAPLEGGGAGSFASWWARHASFRYFVQDAHSLFLETLGELGIVGFVLLTGALGAGAGVGVARLRRLSGPRRAVAAALLGAFAVYVAGAALDWMWELTAVTIAGVAVLGLLNGPATLPEAPGRSRHPDRHVAAVLALAACAVLAAETIVLLSDVELGRSQADARHGRLAGARNHALAATKLEPWAASPYLQLALVDESAGALAEARREIAKAIDRDRDDWRPWLVASRIESRLGEPALASRSYAHARLLDPRSPLFPPG
jgi:hypothetical protein